MKHDGQLVAQSPRLSNDRVHVFDFELIDKDHVDVPPSTLQFSGALNNGPRKRR